MKTNRADILVILSLLFLTLIAASCGGGSDDGTGGTGGTGDTVTASATDVSYAGSSIVTTTTAAFSAASFAISAGKGLPAPLSVMKFMGQKASTLTVTSSSGCQDVLLDSFLSRTAAYTGTIQGSSLDSTGSGSCLVSVYDLGNETIGAELACNSFSGGSDFGNITLDGTIQFAAGEQVNGATVVVLANDVLFGFIENSQTKICEIDDLRIVDILTVEVAGRQVTFTSSTSGCMTVCDESFSISGTETREFTIPD